MVRAPVEAPAVPIEDVVHDLRRGERRREQRDACGLEVEKRQLALLFALLAYRGIALLAPQPIAQPAAAAAWTPLAGLVGVP